MSDKERMIELIQNAVGGCDRYWAERIADCLVKHGATLPHASIGQTVYVLVSPVNWKSRIEEHTVERIVTEQTKNGVRHKISDSMFWNCTDGTGNKVFTSKREAEEIMREMNKRE